MTSNDGDKAIEEWQETSRVYGAASASPVGVAIPLADDAERKNDYVLSEKCLQANLVVTELGIPIDLLPQQVF